MTLVLKEYAESRNYHLAAAYRGQPVRIPLLLRARRLSLTVSALPTISPGFGPTTGSGPERRRSTMLQYNPSGVGWMMLQSWQQS